MKNEPNNSDRHSRLVSKEHLQNKAMASYDDELITRSHYYTCGALPMDSLMIRWNSFSKSSLLHFNLASLIHNIVHTYDLYGT